MADPITREQVERLRAAVRAYIDGGEPVSEHPLCTAFDSARDPIQGNEPEYVIDAWHASGFEPFIAALTRWHAELVAAETPRKVARWDGESHWELSPAHTLSNMTVVTACDRAQAIAWGYTIEGGPEPIDDTAPERLRERRERLGRSRGWAATEIRVTIGTIEALEADPRRDQLRLRYAAALSAAEAERAAKPRRPVTAEERAECDAWLAQPAPMVVDVPQPEPWHARLVRLASDVAAAAKAHEDAQAEREAAERRESEALADPETRYSCWREALEKLADWARERLPAAAERD